MSAPEAQWYYKNGEQITGPCSPAALQLAVRTGTITSATQVRQGENAQWYYANQIPGLIPAAVPPAPPFASGVHNPLSSGAGFFDFRFTRFISPSWISVIWIIAIVLNIISFVGTAFFIGSIAYEMAQGSSGFHGHTPGSPIIAFCVFVLGNLVSLLLHALQLLLARMSLELVLVLFRIEENTRTPR